jgi:hypothetical protein
MTIFSPRVEPTPAPIEDCFLNHCGGRLGCLDHDCQPTRKMTGPSRQSQSSVLDLHARKCGLPPNVATALPIQALKGPLLGLLYVSPSSSPHIMLYRLKTNHFVLWIEQL